MKKKVVISGLGFMGDFGIGKQDFCDFLLHKKAKKEIGDFNFDNYINTTMLRRADDNTHFATSSAKLAIEDALNGLEKIPAEKRGLVIGTTHGPIDFSLKYHKTLVLDNPQMVSPILFSNSTLNIMASYISDSFQIRGYTTTLGGYNSALQAIRCGVDLVRVGTVDICLVGGVDIFHDILNEGYSRCLDNDVQAPTAFGGSGILVVESFESAVKRGAHLYASVAGSEVITADYNKSVKYNISPIDMLLNRLNYDPANIDCVFTSCFNSKESKKRQELYLRKWKQKIPIIDCYPLFGNTFSAAEMFKMILGILILNKESALSKINKMLLKQKTIETILIASVTKLGSNGCLLLEKCKK